MTLNQLITKRGNTTLLRLSFIILAFFYFQFSLSAIIRPIPLEKRIAGAEYIALVTPESSSCYMDADGNIYTLYTCKTKAYLKGDAKDQYIGVIAQGGQINDRKDVVYPSFFMQIDRDYMVFLNKDNTKLDNKTMRSTNPHLIQATPFTYVQGILSKQGDKFYDIATENPQTEVSLFNKILRQLHRSYGVTPNGEQYQPQENHEEDFGFRAVPNITSIEDGTGSASPFVSGTIVTDNELIIHGTNFGATRGNGYVGFSNADNGGNSYAITPTASDYISWSNTEIRVKIMAEAGTGNVLVHNDDGSDDTYAITIDWGVNPVYSDFYDFGEVTRQRVELVDDDTNGGYTYVFNTNFLPNTAAVESFERALSTWRCGVGVNFDRDKSAAVTEEYADDGENVVLFADLSGGTLGVATSRYYAKANSNCTQFDTYWHLKEVDIRFDNSGTNWEYGPDDPDNTESDFESVALHELGHAVGLAHVIQQGELMHYAITQGTTSRVLTASATDAGNHKMAHSVVAKCITDPPHMVAVPAGSCTLPVELISFSGKQNNSTIQLNWTTASEINNDYFMVEHSYDGKHFFPIQKIHGIGDSSEKHDYDLIDKDPFIGNNYYRLKQFDFNKNYTNSKIIAVDFKGDNKLKIHPNPVSNNQITLQYISNKNSQMEVSIYDIEGKTVFSKEFAVKRHLNSMEINISGLAPGVYSLKTIQGGLLKQTRFVKM